MARTRAKANLQRFAYTEDVDSRPPIDTVDTVDIEDIAPPAKRRRTEPAKTKSKTRPAKTVPKKQSAKTKPKHAEIGPPPNWKTMYDAVKDMREKNPTAPVDTMGCAELYWRASSVKDQRFHILVALMLSSQTKDTVTAVAMQRLHTELGQGQGQDQGQNQGEVKKEKVNKVKEEEIEAKEEIQIKEEIRVKKETETEPESTLTLDNILQVSPERLNTLIRTVGFHNNKTKYIKATAIILASQYAGDIPRTAPDLMKLPGVGPKMAYLCMSAAWGQHDGIGVDVHVHRITNLWGWHSTRTPEETREALQSWLPKDRWHEINKLLVGLGQTVCLPVGRRCGECVLAGGLCPSEL